MTHSATKRIKAPSRYARLLREKKYNMKNSAAETEKPFSLIRGSRTQTADPLSRIVIRRAARDRLYTNKITKNIYTKPCILFI